MSDTKLNFINRSKSKEELDIIIFQKNIKENDLGEYIPWHIIKESKRKDTYPFIFCDEVEVSCGDYYGSTTETLSAEKGQRFEIKEIDGKEEFGYSDESSKKNEIQLINNLDIRSVSCQIYRDGLLLADYNDVMPGEQVSFEFEEYIYVGVVPTSREGKKIKPYKETITQLNLKELASADLVMNGGDETKNEPFKFTLRKKVKVK